METLSIKECLELARRPDFSQENYRNVFHTVLFHIQTGESADTAQLNELVDELLFAVTRLFDDNERMKKDIEQLKEEVKRLQCLEADILAGQVALKLEKQFTMILLEDTGIIDNLTLNQLYFVADGHRRFRYAKEKIDKVNENWDKLDEELNLNSENTHDLFGIISDFKTQRNSQAHPSVSLSKASEYLKSSSYSPSDKEKLDRLIEQLIKMKVDEIGT